MVVKWIKYSNTDNNIALIDFSLKIQKDLLDV